MASEDEDFATFFDEFYPGLCRFLECLLGGGRAAAEDIAQESFMRLYHTGFKSLPEGEARFWLFRVARNFALNELNKVSVRQRLLGRVVEAFRQQTPSPEQELEMSERKGLVVEMLKSLPEHQRSALLLREQEGMSYRDIASVLGVAEGKVKVDVFRARTALREKWGRKQRALAGTAG